MARKTTEGGNMSTRLMAALDGARIVRFNPDDDTLLVWFGGHGVHVYDEDGNECDFWSTGDFSQDDAHEDDVTASMLNRLRGRDRLLEEAYEMGARHGESRAEGFFGPGTNEATYRYVLQGIEQGEPDVMEALPSDPLSGEWAGDPTPQSVLSELGVSPDEDADTGEYLDAYEEAFATAVEHSIVTFARRFLRMDDACSECGASIFQDRTNDAFAHLWINTSDQRLHTCWTMGE